MICPETRNGRHRWSRGHIDNPRPHCMACKTDGDVVSAESADRQALSTADEWIVILLLLSPFGFLAEFLWFIWSTAPR